PAGNGNIHLAETQDFNVTDTLTVSGLDSLDGPGQLKVSGNVISTTTFVGNGVLALVGASNTSYTGPTSGAQGKLVINKTSAANVVTLSPTLTFTSLTATQGTLKLNGSTPTSLTINGGF